MSTNSNNTKQLGFLERVFKLKENHTDVKTELAAGLTTFMTMAYILAVNPGILSAAMLMGLLANLPFALSAGMAKRYRR